MARRNGRAPAKATNNFKGEANNRRPRNEAGPSKPRTIHDVYDYAVDQEDAKRRGKQGRVAARAQQATDQDQDEEMGRRRRPAGSDDDSEDSDDARGGVIGTDEELGSDDEDSDIESDEAFGESDDEQYGNYTFASDRRRGAEEDEGEDDEDAGMVDLSTMLGGDGGASGSEDEESGEDDDESEDGEHGDLSSLATSYAQPSKRAGDDEDRDDALPTKRRRRVLSSRTEAGPESEYAAPSRGNLALDDLLAPLSSGAQAGDHSALLNSTKALRGTARNDKQPVASKRGGGALSAPLPDVVKDRLQRSAGYDLSRQEAEKWQPTIKRLREAEHLSFPLQPDTSRPSKPSTAQLAASFKPSNALEQDVDALLQAEGMSEAQIAKNEELAMRHLTPQEQQKRRDELRKMRDLMFRQEQKAKRVSKIKSKTFRKIARKDRERERAKLREAGLLEGESEDGEDDEERLKHERERAQERATLKHKNTGKWAKQQLGKRGGDDYSREALNEQLQKAQQLRRRMEGRGDESSEGESGSDAESNADPARAAYDELRTLDAKEERDAGAEGSKKGVWNMKFMQDARNREDKATQQVRDDLESDLRKMAGQDGSDEDEDDLGDQAVVGRRVFKAAPTEGKSKTIAQPAGKAAAKAAPAVEPAPARSPSRSPSPPPPAREDATPASNPWLVADTTKRAHKPTATSSTSTFAAKSASKLEKRKSKHDATRKEADEDDRRLDIDPEAMLGAAAPKSAKKAVQQPDEDGSDSDEDQPVEMSAPGRRAPRTAFTQRDLIAEAFAGDDVAADFAAQKARVEDEDAPQEQETASLPGWGSWGGKGIKKNRKSGTAASRAAKKTVTPGLDKEKRKDAGMANVIINERKDKKAEKYQVKDLPYPYTSAKQYNAAREQPLGREWNTLTQNQRLTMPKVLATKPGAVIKPIQRV